MPTNGWLPAAAGEMSWANQRAVGGWAPVIAGSTASGLILQVAFPPIAMWPLVFVAFLPVLSVLGTSARVSTWCWAGVTVALVTFAGAPMAMIAWGWEVYLGIWVLASAVFGVIFAASGWLASRAPLSGRWLALPCCWTLGLWLAENVVRVPLSVSLAFGLTRPELLGVARTFGLASVDFLSVAFSAALAAWWSGLLGRACTVGVCGVILAAFASGLLHPSPTAQHWINIAGVQPAKSPAESRSSYWSLSTRSSVELRLDRLTQAALEEASLVVWPEGGDELYNRRLLRRRDKFEQLLQGSRAEIFASGRDFTPDGKLFTVVSHVTAEGFQEDARKSKLVHLAESSVAPGTPTVFDTRVGRIGISICFDAIFSDHVESLIAQGAEALVVVTDDSSFGDAALQDWHVALAVARAVEAGRSLFLVGNYGVSLASGLRGELLGANWSGRQPGFYVWRIPTSDESVTALKGGRAVFYCAILLVGVALAFGGGRAARSRRVGNLPHAILGSGLATVAGVFFGLFAVVLGRGLEPGDVLHDAYRRYAGYGAGVGHVAAFRQRSSSSCGAAALAYTLTMLGDVVFEDEIENQVRPVSANGYSLFELKNAAGIRGFSARGFAGTWADLPRRGMPPVIAHWSRGHFVTVHEAGARHVIVFDPDVGGLVQMSREQFEAEWSGRFLQLRTKDEQDLRALETVEVGG